MPADDEGVTSLFPPDTWRKYVKANHIIFDWDDTLLASSFLTSVGYRMDLDASSQSDGQQASSSSSSSSQSEHRMASVDYDLRELEQSVIEVLHTATKQGNVHIITNSMAGWVHASAKKYMPMVVPMLESGKIQIVSARSQYAKKGVYSPVYWKACAMHDTLEATVKKTAERYKSPVTQCNVLAFGDSLADRQALQQTTFRRPRTLTKSVKFKDRPTIEQLRRQLELVRCRLEDLMSHEGNLDLQLTVTVTAADPYVDPDRAPPHDDVVMDEIQSPPPLYC